MVVWDLLSEAGLFRLKGHRDQVTDVCFLQRPLGEAAAAPPRSDSSSALLLSSSKDGHVRLWELASQSCLHVLGGHRCPVWSLDVDPQERRLVTGAADSLLRVFALDPPAGPACDAEGDASPQPPLRLLGTLQRPSGEAAERVQALRFDASGAFFAVASAGRLLELWAVSSPSEALRRARRRRNRRRAKAEAGEAAVAGEDEDAEVCAADEAQLLCTLPLKHKILGLAFSPVPARGCRATLGLTLGSNEAAAFDLALPGEAGVEKAELRRSHDVLLPGHRADVRSLALSEDDSILLSTSHSGVKARHTLLFADRIGCSPRGPYPRRPLSPCGPAVCRLRKSDNPGLCVCPPPQQLRAALTARFFTGRLHFTMRTAILFASSHPLSSSGTRARAPACAPPPAATASAAPSRPARASRSWAPRLATSSCMT